MTDKIIFLLQISATIFLTGVVWVVQIVQYPFFSYVAAEKFAKYHDDYRFWITPIVAPAMVCELATGILLLVYAPAGIDPKFLWLGLILILIVWVSTFFLQIPLHEKLTNGFEAQTHSLLVQTNWIRTFAWSARSCLMLYFIWKVIRL